MSEALVIFKTISAPKDQEVLLRRFLMSGSKLVLKYWDGTEMLVEPDQLLSPNSLQCRPIKGNSFAYSKRCSSTFVINNEKYLLEVQPAFEDHRGVLVFTSFFHLQRRSNFRYTLPEDYNAQLSFSRLKGENVSVHCKLNDLSTEGCAVTLALGETSISVGEEFRGEIFLGQRDPITVQGRIKNLRPSGDNLVLGIEFDHLATSSESKIVNYITDLQREVYLRAAG
jgi:Predicted glycosyltransferase